MAEHVHTFEGGLDMDSSAFKYPKNKYFSARNLRLTVDEETQQYSLSTIDGAEHIFTISQLDYHGHCFLRNSLVLFLRGILGGTDVIYEINPLNPSITGVTLDSPQIVIQTDLNFTADYKVSAVGSYEGSDIRKVYFSDGENPLRVIDLEKDYTAVTYYADDLNAIPPSDHEGYELTAIKESGNLTAGLVQYSYLLYNKHGSQTYFAPPSVLFPVTKGSVTNLSSYVDSRGGIKEEVCNKSLEFEITNNISTTKFDYIRVVGIYYEDKDIAPTIKILGDYDFTSTTMKFIDTGDGYSGEYTPAEFAVLSNVFTAGSLKSKNNYLFAADIEEDTFDVDIDCRAYRFDENGKAKLLETSGYYYLVYADNTVTKEGAGGAAVTGEWEYFNASGVYQTVTGLDWSIPEDADCICPNNYIEDDFPIDETTGSHTGANNEAILTDALRTWVADELIGATIHNTTDGSSGVITANSPDTVTATLAGGAEDDWDTTDDYYIDVTALWFQYKYQVGDYSTGDNIFGASGKHVEIEISPLEMTSDAINTDNLTTNTSFSDSGHSNGKNQIYQHLSTSMDINGVAANLDTYDNYMSPTLSAYNKSWRRDEIYRKGVVFVDKFNRESYTKWICDVRMPRTFDISYPATVSTPFNLIETGGSQLEFRAIQSTVEVTYSSIFSSADIIGYRVVYVPRTSTNSTILDNGLVGSLEEVGSAINAAYKAEGYVFPTNILQSDWITGGDAELCDTEAVGVISDTDLLNLEETLKEYTSPDINYAPTDTPLHGTKLVSYCETQLSASLYSFNDIAGGDEDNSVFFKKYDSINTEGGDSYCDFDIDDFIVFSDTSYNGGNISTGFSRHVGGNKVYNYSKGACGGANNDQTRGTCGVLSGSIGNKSVEYNFFTEDVANTETEALYVARKQVIEPYGGLSYEDRLQNTYEECSPFIYFDGSTKSIACGGDTYIGMFEHIRTMLTASETTELDSNNMEVLYFVCESNFNIVLRTDSPIYKLHDTVRPIINLLGVHEVPGTYEIDDAGPPATSSYEQDWYMYDNNNTYSRNNFVKSYTPAPLGYTVGDTYRHDTKIISSEQKSNRELIDNWTRFLFANEIELKTEFGPITNIDLVSDNLISIQEKAIASIAINEREQITGQTGVALTLGTGGILERYDYINTDGGCQDKYGHVVTPTGLYYYDGYNKGIFALTQKGEPSVSKVGFMDSYFKNQTYSDFDVLSIGYDRSHNEVLFTFYTGYLEQETLVFNDIRGYFTHFLDTNRGHYVYDDRIMYTLSTQLLTIKFYKQNIEDSLIIDSKFATDEDLPFDCDLTIISRPEHPDLSRFDQLEWNSVVKATTTDAEQVGTTFNNITCSNTYQSTGVLSHSLFKRRMRSWRLNALRDSISIRSNLKPRLRSEWLRSRFSFSPSNNKLLIDSIKVIFSPNKV